LRELLFLSLEKIAPKSLPMTSNTNTLWRGGRSIQVQKEASYFTAILPSPEWGVRLQTLPGVKKCQSVFDSVYKIETEAAQRDELMTMVRSTMHQPIVAHHAYHPVGDPVTRYYLTDQLLVSFSTDLSDQKLEHLLEQHGLAFQRTYTEDERTLRLQVTASAGKNPVKVAEDLQLLPEVKWAEVNLVNRFASQHRPTDDLYPRQWHLQSKRGLELIPEADISAEAAWEITRGSRDVVVAVIDDGFDITHPDLKDKVVHPRDFVDGDTQPFPTRKRGEYHGTPCAGLAVGAENGKGIVGVAPGCSFLPIRFDLAADDNLLWEIFDHAGKYADVISCSWGPVPVNAPLSQLVADKFSEVSECGGPRGNGALICFAAGNFNAPVKSTENRRFAWRHPQYGLLHTDGPIENGNAVHPDVLCVSASTSQNLKAAYSNWGDEIGICAPSNNWHPIDSQARLPGRSLWTTDNEAFGLGFNTYSRYTGQFGGTSGATPIVAGVAALVRSVHPELPARDVKQILQTTADAIEDRGTDILLGYKYGVYDENGHSRWFGFGKVNAARAVQAAVDLLGEKESPTPTVPAGAVQLISALVNPHGRDSLREHITLLNVSDESITLLDWTLEDAHGRVQPVTVHQWAPGTFLTLPARVLRLSNRGGEIRLKRPDGKLEHRVRYDLHAADRPGWTVVFNSSKEE
jgi:subtilisin family serine protease